MSFKYEPSSEPLHVSALPVGLVPGLIGENLFIFQNLAAEISTKFDLTSNIEVFVWWVSLPDSKRKTGFPGLGRCLKPWARISTE